MIWVYASLIVLAIVIVSAFHHPNIHLSTSIRLINAIVLFNATYQFTKILHGCS